MLDSSNSSSNGVWVCLACGKTSPIKYGGVGASRGWDVSCSMNSRFLDKRGLRYENDLVVEVIEIPK